MGRMKERFMFYQSQDDKLDDEYFYEQYKNSKNDSRKSI